MPMLRENGMSGQVGRVNNEIRGDEWNDPLGALLPSSGNAAGPKLPPSVESHGRCHSAGREKYNYLHSLSPRLSTPVTRASSATTRKQLRWERVAADERGGES